MGESTSTNVMADGAATVNIAAPAVLSVTHGTRRLGVAPPEVRAIAQHLIDTVEEHKHLRLGEARVLVLIEQNDGTADKLRAGERVSVAKAARAPALVRLMFGRGEAEAPRRPDFTITVQAAYLAMIEDADDRETRLAALIDHELCHCGCKVGGRFVDPGDLEAAVEAMGEDHIETCPEVTDEEGAVLVRSIARKDGGIVWKMRRHDIEEFHGIAERHGAWDRDLVKLVDVLVVEDETPLFETAAG